MRALTLEEVAAAIGGRILGRITIPTVTGVSTDTRRLEQGSLFFAIPGGRYDGHAFVEEALDKGAAAAVVQDPSRIGTKYHDGGRLISVADTIESLGRLAAWYRKQSAAAVIAVAGSNGKTTTKDMIATVLAAKKRGRAAPASFNNAIGVPLTLLSVDPADEFIVVEIGTNHPGEVAALGRIARPDMVVMTSIGEEHLEFFTDLESVASEEFSLLGTTAGGRRAFLAMSEQAAAFAPAEAVRDRNTLTYGLAESSDLRAVDLAMDRDGYRFKVNGRFDYRIGMLGRHNVVNALAAVAIGRRMRLTHEEIAAALSEVRAPAMRMERSALGSITLINDAYNANPASMRAALEVMDHLPPAGVGSKQAGRKVLVLGEMLELGDAAARCHQELGRAAGRSTAHVIIAVGANARVTADGATAAAGTSKRIYAFPSREALAAKVAKLVKPGDVVMLKASRACRLERLIEPLEIVARQA